jgi:putative transferase (TIGR04331 family)
LVDKFLTLGWKTNDERFISCSTLFPFKIKKASKKDIPILHINYTAEQHAPHYSSNYSTFGHGAVEYLRFLKQYFDYLPDKIKKVVNLRSYPKDYPLLSLCYDQKKFLEKELCDVNYIESFKLTGETCKEQIARAKIVVIDAMYTAYLESLSMNVPTICFYDKKTRFLKDEYNDFYDDLIGAKILHSSPKSAAEHLIAVHENPHEWWNDLQTQKLKNRWLRGNLGKPEVLIDFLLKLSDHQPRS